MAFNFGGLFTASEGYDGNSSIYITQASGWDGGSITLDVSPLLFSRGSAIKDMRISQQAVSFTIVIAENSAAVINALNNQMLSRKSFTVTRSRDGKSKELFITEIEEPEYFGHSCEVTFNTLQIHF